MKAKLFVTLAVVALCMAIAVSMSAQVQSQTSTRTTGANVTTSVDKAEVVYISGNDVVIKMQDGSIRHFNNVPDSVKVTVDGQQLGVRDLKVGMKLQRTMTTTTRSQVITTVKTVSGKVWQVNPPTTLILTMDNGENKSFKIPKGQKFNIDGTMVDAFGLRKGMLVSATQIIQVPQEVIDHQRKLSGTMPPPPPPPPVEAPILIAQEAPAPAPAPEAPATLPKTGSPLPLIGFLGMLSLASSLGLSSFRNKFGK